MEKYSYLYERASLFLKLASMTQPEARHLLGVSDTATEAEVQKAYKQKAKEFHPDLNKSPEAHHKMVAINTAREILLSSKEEGLGGGWDWKPPTNQVNQAMKKKLEEGSALDVQSIGREIKPGLYQLDTFDENAGEEFNGMDYADATRQIWIVSIGRDRETGKVYASTDGRFYENPKYECVWLR